MVQDLNANIALNDGTQHRLKGAGSNPPTGELDTSVTYGVKPGDDATASNVFPGGQQPLLSGFSTASNRVVDVDVDGRPDVVQFRTSSPLVFFNGGGQFLTPSATYFGDRNGLTRISEAVNNSGDTKPTTWKLNGDLVDLDGNGIPEAVYFQAGVFQRVEHNTAASPPRLLQTIKNNRGALTTITYASMHDSTTVIQSPNAFWPDGRPKASPHNQWVVKNLSVRDAFPITDSVTSYFYKNPRHGADDEGHYSFRGFEEITATAPSGAQSVQRYEYNTARSGFDWSGRLVASLVLPAATDLPVPVAGEVRSIDRTTWEPRLLLGAITTYHPTITEHFTCANAKTEVTCTATPAAYTRSTSVLTALAGTADPAKPLLWQTTSTLLQSSTSPADGDRKTLSTFALYTGGGPTQSDVYRLRPLTAVRQHQVGGSFVIFGKAAKTWDATFRVQNTDEVWFDNLDANRAITQFVWDIATGNLLERLKPNQYAAGTTRTTSTYDSRKLFAVTEVNELGHQMDYTFDYGTGIKLQTDGPNVRSCVTGCPTGSVYPIKEQHKIRTDGLGRTIEQWDTTSFDGVIYTLTQRELTSYVDLATATVPTSVSHQTRLDSAGPTWKMDKAELDGHGRPIKQIVFAQGSAPNDQITTFQYRSDGTLQTVQVPDPTANSAAVVAYTYTFDSLGRPLSIRRPDAVSLPSQSGVDLSYNGVVKTVTEAVGAATGQIAVTRTTSDSFGRLVKVEEQTAAVPLTWATTQYSFGPDDMVIRVVDPQSVTTTMAHDFAGHRTQVTRSGRTWQYGYDRNGNMTSEQVPGSPTPPMSDVRYISTFAYDDLDRPSSKSIAQRELSTQDQTAFGNRTETFTWDYGPNHKGYLRYWQTFAPNAVIPTVTLDVYNDNQGHPTTTKQTLNVAGYPELQRQFIQNYYLFGGVSYTQYRDNVGGSNETSAYTQYDARFLPLRMVLARQGMTQQNVAVQTRNVAGLVTKRHTDTTAGAMTFVESNWVYDKLGRVTSQIVQKGPGPTQVVRQDLAYFGNDDPKSLDHYLGTTQRHFNYGYDLRHQILSAQATTTGYFTGTYQYGAAGRLVRATEAQTIAPLPAGTEVKPRDVTYQYAGIDPEQITGLIIASGAQTGTPYAKYTYDAAGNQLTRCYGATSTPCTGELTEYVYDGSDQLRRATKKLNSVVQGSEEYFYGNGGRLAVVKRDASGAKTEVIWTIGDAEAHYDAAGTVTHVYSHLSLGTPIARVDRTANATTTVEFQFHGLASNTIAAVDQAGTINTSLSYSPFGAVIESTNGGGSAGTTAHRRRFNDKQVDEISELNYYGARYYDKTMLGWTQSDPQYRFAPDAASTDPRRATLYTSDLNNPLRYIDPDGHDSSPLTPFVRFIASAMEYGVRQPVASSMDTRSPAPFPITTGYEDQALGHLTDLAWEGAVTGRPSGELTVAMLFIIAFADNPTVSDGEVLGEVLGDAGDACNVCQHPTFEPGLWAKDSIPARSSSQKFDAPEREFIDTAGYRDGCHTCGARTPGTKGGHFVPDHQPVTALNKNNKPQRLYPQCLKCSREQGLAAARIRKAEIKAAKAAKLKKNMNEGEVPIENRSSF